MHILSPVTDNCPSGGWLNVCVKNEDRTFDFCMQIPRDMHTLKTLCCSMLLQDRLVRGGGLGGGVAVNLDDSYTYSRLLSVQDVVDSHYISLASLIPLYVWSLTNNRKFLKRSQIKN